MATRSKILLIDDDRNLLRVVAYQITEAGFDVIPLSSPKEALARLDEESVDLVLTDLRMPEMSGLDLMRQIRLRRPDLPVIVLTAFGSIDTAVEAIKNGASDFLTKPFASAEVLQSIRKALRVADLVEENRRLTRAVEERFDFKGIVGGSKAFRDMLEMAAQLAQVDTTVLIQGESGTGKELVARAIHFNSKRKSRPFVVVNCGAIPFDLIESELFGYRKGAFTGAIADKKGKFEAADSGTIFLDEVGDLAPPTQVKLLRVLQQREVDIVGETIPRPVDVRVIAATNRDLQSLMRTGGFREDLFYRLAVAPLLLPPLRQRKDDIPMLVRHALQQITARIGKSVSIDDSVIDALRDYDWPGNVRELENLLERLVVFNRSGCIRTEDLPLSLRPSSALLARLNFQLPEQGFSLEQLEQDILFGALHKNGWNQSQTARYLGISRNTLIYRMQKYHLRENDETDTVAGVPEEQP